MAMVIAGFAVVMTAFTIGPATVSGQLTADK